MADPTPTTTTTSTTTSTTVTSADLRQRAAEWHAAADRAETSRYTQRGEELDEVARAAGAARHEADAALQQAQRERAAAQEFAQDARDLAEQAQNPQNDVRFAQQMATRRAAQARAAEQRAEALARTAETEGARATALEAHVAELREVADDQSVSLAIRGKAGEMDRAADQVAHRERLLEGAADAERDAAAAQARGETLEADVLVDRAAELRAEADAIQPEIPQLDERILRAVDPSAPVDPTAPVDPNGPAVSGPAATPTPMAGMDSDGDGLSDALERELGTKVTSPDTDGDGRSDGVEVAVGIHNPRAAGAADQSTDDIAAAAESRVEWEQARGLAPNADSDGDGFADWVEALGGLNGQANLTADSITHNRSPMDQFLHSAQEQVGKPYRFGAEVDPTDFESPTAFDSSELVEYAAKQAGVRDMPDGSWKQYQHLHDAGGAIPVEEALSTKGALVFGFSSDPLTATDRPARAYVGISLGDGRVLDVSERAGEVRVMEPGNYTHAAVIPQLHWPQGDLDGDGWTDQEELIGRGDLSRGITVPKGVDPVNPTVNPAAGAAAAAATTAAATTLPSDLVPGVGTADDDPTGSSRYEATTATPADADPSGTRVDDAAGYGPDEGGAATPGSVPEGRADPAYGGPQPVDPYEPVPVDPYEAPAAPAAGGDAAPTESYDNSYADDTYSDSSSY